MIDLTEDELDLLRWLSREQYSQFGECHGRCLDALIARGLARVDEDGGTLGNFIAKTASPDPGKRRMFNSVSLTDKGRIVALGMTAKGND